MPVARRFSYAGQKEAPLPEGLTCAEQDDGGADVEPSHDTAGERQDAIRKLKNPQPESGGIVVYKFVWLAALWAPEFTS
jgi:hypothetical protein